MFQQERTRSRGGAAFGMLELIYHSIVRNVTKTHSNAFVALLMNMLQACMFVAAFYFMFSVLGLRGMALRGDFLIFIMSGIFLFLTHTKVVGAVVGSEGPASPMMKHAPMNTIIAISGTAFSVLYIQVLTMFVIFWGYNVAVEPIHFDKPIAAFGCFLVAWLSGVAVGMVLLALKPWMPAFVSIASAIYQRANMISSGKMFVANSLPPSMLALFDWNPLFHAIDQSRGYSFINYTPRNSSIEYPLILSLVLIMIGLMLEFYTRKHASESWSARA